MKIILQKDVAKVGHEGEVVTVADGFARNYLLPRSLAVPATGSAMKVLEKRRAEEKERSAQMKTQAENDAASLEGKTVSITARAGSSDRLFGSITSQDVADAMQKSLGINVDKRKIQLIDPIKSLGTFTVPVKLHNDVTVPVSVQVVKAE